MGEKSQGNEASHRKRAAQFFARLASNSAWNDLSAGQSRVLEEEFLSIWPRKGPLEPGELPMAHVEVEKRLRELLEGREVFPIFAAIARWQLKGTQVREVVAEEAADAFGPDGLRWRVDLRDLILEDPFPFRRCLRCGSIFAFVKRQLYCTPTCAREAAEAARKGTRREYMRDLMAKKRARERAKKQRKRR